MDASELLLLPKPRFVERGRVAGAEVWVGASQELSALPLPSCLAQPTSAAHRAGDMPPGGTLQ